MLIIAFKWQSGHPVHTPETADRQYAAEPYSGAQGLPETFSAHVDLGELRLRDIKLVSGLHAVTHDAGHQPLLVFK